MIYTFYSYKGGVGRSMAVANTAALLARWGHSVLVVDWDLEAPGIERFFVHPSSEAAVVAESKPGIIDLILGKTAGESISWRDCVHSFKLEADSAPVYVISAGRRSADYLDRMQRLDFPVLFEKHDLGAYIEQLRQDWASEFNYVLIDSRTGVTDIGGICTVHLADVLVLVFTATNSSVDGGLDVVNRAREARSRLPLDRGALLVVPLPSRDESRTEYKLAEQWKSTFAKRFEPMYRDWLPSGTTTAEAVELLKIPYVSYWSFGERIPALEESPTDPGGLAYAYEILGRLLASKLDWSKAINGQPALAPPPRTERRYLDDSWAERQFRTAQKGLAAVGKTGYFEIYHCCVDSPINRAQDELLVAAREAMVHNFGRPIGLVLDKGETRPMPTNEGIVASVGAKSDAYHTYDFWALTKTGYFYALMSLSEDDLSGRSLFFDTRIIRVAEGLLHCERLYRAMGVYAGATIQFRVRFGGLRGRQLSAANPAFQHYEAVNQVEDQVTSSADFRLDQLDANLSQVVNKLCSNLLILFDFVKLPDAVYEKIVSNFIAGTIP